MAKERKIVEVEETDDSKRIGVDSKGKLVEVKELPKSKATSKRIFAFILWAIGIFCEVVAILRINGTINWFEKLDLLTFIIIFLVIDFVAVVIGSQLWKKANHIDPASEKNKTKFWLHNNLGSIISVIAFLPILIVILTNKDMDKKTKTIAGALAAVLLVVAGISSYDFNPVSQEQLNRAEQEVLATKYDTDENGNAIVYWATYSKKYHVNKDCPSLKNSETIYHGTVKAAYQNNLTEPCRICIPELDDHDHDHTNE